MKSFQCTDHIKIDSGVNASIAVILIIFCLKDTRSHGPIDQNNGNF